MSFIFRKIKSGVTELFTGDSPEPSPKTTKVRKEDRVAKLLTTKQLEALETKLGSDLSRVDREQRKVIVKIVAARNLHLPSRHERRKETRDEDINAYCQVLCSTNQSALCAVVREQISRLSRQFTTATIKGTCSPVFEQDIACAMDRPEEPIDLMFFHQNVIKEDEFIGRLSITPAELCRKLPANGWWSLKGVGSGELWITAEMEDARHRQNYRGSQSEGKEDAPVSVCDSYGFSVPPCVQGQWALSRSYIFCLQERARVAWEPHHETVLMGNPAAEILLGESKMLLLQSGPPPELRARVLHSFLVYGTSRPYLLGAEPCGDDDEYYRRMCDTEAPAEVLQQVELDLPRTFRSRQTLISTPEGTAALKRVLLAHAVHNPNIGYCQCFNSIAGLLLSLPGMDERHAFDVLCCLPLVLDGWYSYDLNGVRRDMKVLEAVAAEALPALANSTETLGLPLGLVISGMLMPLLIETLPTDTLLRLLDGICYLVVQDDTNVFGLLLGAVLVALRVGEAELIVATNVVSFKDALVHTFQSMLDGESLLRNALIEMKQIGAAKLRTLRQQAMDQQASEEADIDLQYCMNISRTAAGSGLSEEELAHLMQRVVDVAGSLSKGKVDNAQFHQLMNSVHPQMSQMFKERMYESCVSSDGTVDFKSLAVCISALCGATSDTSSSLQLMFRVFDADHDGSLSLSESVQLMMSILPLIYHGQLSDKEMQIMCMQAFEELDKDNNGSLSLEEFALFTSRFPIIDEFLQLQSQRCKAAIGEIDSDNNEDHKCPIQ